MSYRPVQRPQSEPKLDEPYESLVAWQGHGAEPGSNVAEEAKARLQTVLARDLTKAIALFNRTTTYLNWILIALTAVLVFLGVIQLLMRK